MIKPNITFQFYVRIKNVSKIVTMRYQTKT